MYVITYIMLRNNIITNKSIAWDTFIYLFLRLLENKTKICYYIFNNIKSIAWDTLK